MRFALNKMTRKSKNQERYKITARLFEIIRTNFAKDMSDMKTGKKRGNLSDNHKLALSVSSKGIPKSKEAVINMTAANRKTAELWKINGDPRRGRSHTDDAKLKMRKPKIKSVCRLSDRKEMDIGNYVRWSKSQQ
jgi:hypothetical protein